MLIDADQHMLAGRPGAADGVGLHIIDHVAVDMLGGLAQRQFAQGGQIAGRKEMAQRPLGLRLDIDLAFLKPLQKVVGGQYRPARSHRLRPAHASGTVSRTWMRVIWAMTSFRLSICWILTVVKTSMPAARSSSTS